MKLTTEDRKELEYIVEWLITANKSTSYVKLN
jgi:hypothetical protein